MKLFHSKGYKVISGLVYGWGASCVIIGALFKIMHFPGAGIILTVGMLVEAFIFFFSAFEPQMEHYDWKQVFPQLAGKMGNAVRPAVQETVTAPAAALSGMEPREMDRLKQGISKFADTADALAGVAGQVPNFARNLGRVAETFGQLDSQSRQMGEALGRTAAQLSSGSEQWSRVVADSAAAFSEQIRANCSKMVEGMTRTGEQFSALGKLIDGQNQAYREGTVLYKQKVDEMARHISALNTLYELNLSETKQGLESFRKAQGEVAGVLQHVAGSRESTERFKQEASALADKVASLNSIYGNMLSLVNHN